MQAKDVMTQHVVSVEPGDTVLHAIRVMLQNEISGLPVVDKGGRSATKRSVQLGRRNSDFIEVLSGLKPGEQVITSSYSGLVDKDQLTFDSDD